MENKKILFNICLFLAWGDNQPVQWLDICHCHCAFLHCSCWKGLYAAALLFVPAVLLFMPMALLFMLWHCSLCPWHFSLFHGIALLPWYCTSGYGVFFATLHTWCVSSCRSVGDCVGIFLCAMALAIALCVLPLHFLGHGTGGFVSHHAAMFFFVPL